MKKKLSVLIRNRNEERWIGYAIQSVLDQNHLLGDTEIIILDDHSTDDSLRVVREFCFEDIKLHTVNDYTPGKSLNEGAFIAEGDIIMTLSAHAQIQNVLPLERIGNILDSGNVAVFGNQTPLYKGKRMHKRYLWSHFGDLEVQDMWSTIEERYFLHNAFAFYERKTLLMYRFDEKLAGKEDRYWANNLISNEHKHIMYNPDMEILHHWTPNGNTWKGLS